MTTCEWSDCQEDATCAVHAQWTVVDFVEYAACTSHADHMCAVLARRRVDGELPVDVWITPWDKLDEEVSA